MHQSTALHILQSGANVFLTGAAGTGKTYVLKQFLHKLHAHGIPVGVTASTGIAATHLSGQTIHSWSGMGIKSNLKISDMERIAKKKVVRQRIEKAEVLIIDEISMLSRQFLTDLDHLLQYIRINHEPFGGIQMVFCGDFFQLPPVSRKPIPNKEKFAFMAPVWVQAKLKICYLSKQFRQTNDDLANFLNAMREDELDYDYIEQIEDCLAKSKEKKGKQSNITRLFTHNADVDALNAQELAKLAGAAKIFHAGVYGNSTMVQNLKKSVLAPEHLYLKIGAKVMFIKNSPKGEYANGTVGEIISFSGNFPVVQVENRKIIATPDEWRVNHADGTAAASFTQIPLRLAWAITIHKSQGMTLTSAEMDLSRTFEPGQGYVALSRVKNWEGLTLLGINNAALALNPLAKRADVRFKEISLEDEAKAAKIPEEKHKKMWEARIKKLGGTLDAQKMQENLENLLKKAKNKAKTTKVSTYMLTLALVKQKKSILEIMKARKMSEPTIFRHLEALVQQEKAINIQYLHPNKPWAIEIEKAINIVAKNATPDFYDANNLLKLGPIHEYLEEKYNYRQIQLMRVFYLQKKQIIDKKT